MGRKKILKSQNHYSKNTQNKKNKNMDQKKQKYNPTKLKKNMGLIEYSPSLELQDEEFIALAIWECLKSNDPEGVVEVIHAHLEAVNKARAAQKAQLARSSLYNALKGKNPTVKTLAKLVNCCA